MAGGWTRWGWLRSVLTPVRWSPLVASSNQNLAPIIWVWPVSSDHPQSAHRPCSDPADSTLHYTSCWQYTALDILLTVPYCTSCWLFCTTCWLVLYCTTCWLVYFTTRWLCTLQPADHVLYCTSCWLCKYFTVKPADCVLYSLLTVYFTVKPADCVLYCKTCWLCTLL